MKTSRQLRARALYIDKVTKYPGWTERRIHNSVQKELNKDEHTANHISRCEKSIVLICAIALVIVLTLHIVNQ